MLIFFLLFSQVNTVINCGYIIKMFCWSPRVKTIKMQQINCRPSTLSKEPNNEFGDRTTINTQQYQAWWKIIYNGINVQIWHFLCQFHAMSVASRKQYWNDQNTLVQWAVLTQIITVLDINWNTFLLIFHGRPLIINHQCYG